MDFLSLIWQYFWPPKPEIDYLPNDPAITIAPEVEPKKHLKLCLCGHTATYRAQLIVHSSDTHILDYVSRKTNLTMSSLMDPMALKLAVIKADNFWNRTIEDNHHRIIYFIACDSCIDDLMKPKMTYHADGWLEPAVYENLIL